MDVVTKTMKRTPIARPVAVSLVSALLVTQGCQQERGTPPPPPSPTTATTSQPSTAPVPEAPLEDERKADRIAVSRCCAALQNKLNTIAAEQRGTYSFALGVCKAARGHRKGKAIAFARVQKALGKTKPPGACR